MEIPKNVKYILKKLNGKGHEALVVGGCVRDSLMGIVPKDWDVTTSATPIQIKECFSHTHDTGIKHGTITVVIEKSNYEVTTYRIDGEYLDNRHPSDVVFTTNLEEDLVRRDFTMNAIAFHEDLGFVDPFGGIDDIKKKKICAVLEPSKRFQEDALRMLRAVRFSAQLGFDIEPKTLSAIEDNAHLISNISVERVRDEFTKLLLTSRPSKIEILQNSNLMHYMLPQDFQSSCEQISLSNIIDCISLSDLDIEIRLTLMLQFLQTAESTKILKYFKYDNKTIKNVSSILKYINVDFENDSYLIRKYLSNNTPFIFKKVLKAKLIISAAKKCDTEIETLENICTTFNAIIKNEDCISLKELKINGNDLKKLGITDGKEIGDKLKFLLDEVLKCPQNNDFEILKSLLDLPQN